MGNCTPAEYPEVHYTIPTPLRRTRASRRALVGEILSLANAATGRGRKGFIRKVVTPLLQTGHPTATEPAIFEEERENAPYRSGRSGICRPRSSAGSPCSGRMIPWSSWRPEPREVARRQSGMHAGLPS